MHALTEAYDNIYCIWKEVTDNVNKLKNLQAEALRVSPLISQKEREIANLKQEVEDLKRQNSEIDEIISSEATEKEQYDDQALQIQELVLRFKEEIDSYKTGIEIKQEIPQKAQLVVEMKINEVIQTVSSEYTQPKLEEYEKERRKLKRINDELKNEIDLLRKFNYDWTPINNFDFAIDECMERYSTDQNLQNASFSDVDIPMNDDSPKLMENAVSVNPPTLLPFDSITQEIQMFANLLHEQNSFVKSIYNSQLNFFSHLRDSLKEKTITEQDLRNLEEQLQIQVQQTSEFTDIYPLQIPEFKIYNPAENNDLSPVDILSNQFKQFCEKLHINDHNYSLCNEYEEKIKKVLKIPEFTQPRRPNYEKQSNVNPDLIKLSNDLQHLIDLAKTIKISNEIEEITGIQNQILEAKHQKLSKSKNIIYAPKIIQPIEDDDQELKELKGLLDSRLPDDFKEIFEINTDDLFVSDDLSPDSQSDNTNEIAELLNEKESSFIEEYTNFKKAVTNIHEILTEFLYPELPPAPHFIPPSMPSNLNIETVDTQNLMKSVDLILDHMNDSSLQVKRDISQLENQIYEIKGKMTAETIKEEQNLLNRVEQLQLEKENLSESLQTMNKKVNETVENQIKPITNKKKQLEKEIRKLKESIITDEMINEKKIELDDLQEKVTKFLEEQLHEGL